MKYQWWKVKGRKVFTSPIDQLMTEQDRLNIKSLPKAFYAPLKVSTKDWPFYKKIFYHLRHSRPLWYKKYHTYRFVHYLHFGILLIYSLFLGFNIYHGFIDSRRAQTAVLGANESAARVLSFSGRLTDAANTPITKASNLRFSLYSDEIASGSALLWEEAQIIKPDQDGNFQTVLGQHQALTQSILSNNPRLFLGITIGSEKELAPRQQIATVAYTKDSEKLQGMLPSTDSNAKTSNIILALDSSGDLTIGGKASPKFEATGGEFTLSGQTLTLTTVIDSNSNIQLSPDGTGIIDAQKPIQNTTNYGIIPEAEGMVQVADSLGIIAESSTQSALLINQNGIGNFISANGNGSAKFSVDYLGNGMFAEDVTINGNNLTSDSYTFNLFNKNVINLSIGAEASSISIGATSGATLINNSLTVKGTSNFEGEVKASGLITAAAGLTVAEDKNLTLDGFTPGSVTFIGDNKQISEDINNLFWDQANKRLGLGTVIPSYRLDVRDNQAATAAAQIYNSNAGADAGGLILKLGASTASITNKFLSFQTATGEISSITGNGSNGIQIALNSPGDWAEYIKKDQSESIPFGSLVCINEDGNATACDESNNKILGVASEHPTVIAGKNLGDGSIAVGLTGLVKTFVLSQNGDIKPGDLITYSETPGVGIKAIRKGMVVGRALEAYENTNSTEIGSILIVLQANWYDPGTELTQAGDIIAQPLFFSESNLPAIFSNIFENLTAGVIEAKTISTDSLSIATDNIMIGGQTLKQYIQTIVNEAVEAKSQELIASLQKTQQSPISPISPISSPTSSSSALAKTEANASLSGTLADALATQTASPAANYITNITNMYNTTSTPSADQEQIVATNSAILDSLCPMPYALCPNIITGFPRFEQGILALGASSLTDVSINGSLYLGQGTVLSENSINTIGANLELQPLRQGNLSIMGELVTIDTEGNLKVSGNASFAKDVEVKGVLSANIISPVPDSDLIIKLQTNFVIHDSSNNQVLSISNLGDLIASGAGTFKSLATQGLTIIRGAQADTSFIETIASGSAGTAVITAYETERTIKTPFVKEGSLIYIAPTSDMQGVTPYVARQVAESKNIRGSFTIQVSHPVYKNIEFNWFIVN